MVLGLISLQTPLWDPPAGFDAYSYLRMSENPLLAQQEVATHHFQRILPALLVRLTHAVVYAPLFQWHPPLIELKFCFRLLSVVFFVVFALQLNRIIQMLLNHYWDVDQRQEGQKGHKGHKKDWIPYYAFSLALFILFYKWPMYYPIQNFYQLCDLLSNVLLLGMIQSLMEKKYASFAWLGAAGIFTRQNLLVLLIFGNFYFYWEKRDKKIIFATIFHIVLIIILFSVSSVTKTAQHLFMFPSATGVAPWKSLYSFLQPFLFTYLLYLPQMKRWQWREHLFLLPVLLFCLVTIYQPFAAWKWTGIVNLERIIMQGIWPITLGGGLLLINFIEKQFTASRRKLGWFLRILFLVLPLSEIWKLTINIEIPYYHEDYPIIFFHVVVVGDIVQQWRQYRCTKFS